MEYLARVTAWSFNFYSIKTYQTKKCKLQISLNQPVPIDLLIFLGASNFPLNCSQLPPSCCSCSTAPWLCPWSCGRMTWRCKLCRGLLKHPEKKQESMDKTEWLIKFSFFHLLISLIHINIRWSLKHKINGLTSNDQRSMLRFIEHS